MQFVPLSLQQRRFLKREVKNPNALICRSIVTLSVDIETADLFEALVATINSNEDLRVGYRPVIEQPQSFYSALVHERAEILFHEHLRFSSQQEATQFIQQQESLIQLELPQICVAGIYSIEKMRYFWFSLHHFVVDYYSLAGIVAAIESYLSSKSISLTTRNTVLPELEQIVKAKEKSGLCVNYWDEKPHEAKGGFVNWIPHKNLNRFFKTISMSRPFVIDEVLLRHSCKLKVMSLMIFGRAIQEVTRRNEFFVDYLNNGRRLFRDLDLSAAHGWFAVAAPFYFPGRESPIALFDALNQSFEDFEKHLLDWQINEYSDLSSGPGLSVSCDFQLNLVGKASRLFSFEKGDVFGKVIEMGASPQSDCINPKPLHMVCLFYDDSVTINIHYHQAFVSSDLVKKLMHVMERYLFRLNKGEI